MHIHIEIIADDPILPESCCRTIISRVLKAEGFSGYDLTLVLADNRLLRRLNRRFRGLDRPTDVISFALLEGTPLPLPSRQLGDIYISRTRRQARQYRVTPQEELARLMIHGVLHLLGYDHIRTFQARKMRRLEGKYLDVCRRFYRLPAI
jgi:probable rRNA maturation factor